MRSKFCEDDPTVLKTHTQYVGSRFLSRSTHSLDCHVHQYRASHANFLSAILYLIVSFYSDFHNSYSRWYLNQCLVNFITRENRKAALILGTDFFSFSF